MQVLDVKNIRLFAESDEDEEDGKITTGYQVDPAETAAAPPPIYTPPVAENLLATDQMVTLASSGKFTKAPRYISSPLSKELTNIKYLTSSNSTNANLYYDLESSGSEDSSIEEHVLPEDDSPIDRDVDWNQRYIDVLEQKDSISKFESLVNLGKDFVSVAEIYGKIIISEYYQPRKTIPRAQVGGLASGDKYICEGILFKFILDPKLPNTSYYIYGGDKPDDEHAMKAAGNEKKGLMVMTEASRDLNFNFPLMVLIHYRGFCLLASSMLPIDKSTLKYGSSDGGKTVHKENHLLNQQMQEAATRMNLSPHTVHGEVIYGPGDIEGHVAGGRFYVVDLGRVMPPEAPQDGSPRSIFYNLLRPSLVAKLPYSLCSDAFTNWISSPREAKILNARALHATTYLYNTVIPSFAKWLDENQDYVVELSHLIYETHKAARALRYLYCYLQAVGAQFKAFGLSM